MGLRDIAAAAVEADAAAKKLAREQAMQQNIQAAKRIIQQHLGVAVDEVTSVLTGIAGAGAGYSTVVRIEDVHIKITELRGDSAAFQITDKAGNQVKHPTLDTPSNYIPKGGGTVWVPVEHYCSRFSDAVGMASALRAYDAFLAATTVQEVVNAGSTNVTDVRYSRVKVRESAA